MLSECFVDKTRLQKCLSYCLEYVPASWTVKEFEQFKFELVQTIEEGLFYWVAELGHNNDQFA